MIALVADRFVKRNDADVLDLATGRSVVLRLADAGDAGEQRTWSDHCAQSLNAGSTQVLIDFGFVGRRHRFEAYRKVDRSDSSASEPDAGNGMLSEAIAEVADWLEDGASLSRLLRVEAPRTSRFRWLEALGRDLRGRGFVPVHVSLLQKDSMWTPLLEGRPVVLLAEGVENGCADQQPAGGALCLGILKLLTVRARTAMTVHTIFEDRPESHSRVAHAAEHRPVYASPPRSHIVVDARAAAWLEAGRQSWSRGRHAAAERAFRAAFAAFERRRDLRHAAEAQMLLGRLMLSRGRATDAERQFSAARERFENVAEAAAAVAACIHEGLAQTDEARLEDAASTLRSALSAATAMSDQDSIGCAAIALARNLYWQKHFIEALHILHGIAQRACPRYWTLMARLYIATGRLDAACESARKAREVLSTSPGMRPDEESAVRTAQALVQARLGDVDALCFHARAGMSAARAAHLPLQTLRLRLTLIEGLLDGGFESRARTTARRLDVLAKAALPGLLKNRVTFVLDRLAGRTAGQDTGRAVPAVHEAASCFLPDHCDALAELLSACQSVEDERAALKAVAEIVRRQTDAIAVGIFATADDGEPVAYATVGTLGVGLARRCMELVQSMPPERGSGGVEGGAPIVHLGRPLGSVVCRWTLEGPRRREDPLSFARLAAAACAPLLQVMIERMRAHESKSGSDELDLIGVSAGIQDVRRCIMRAANAPFTVLIEGESGSGKELVARAIHLAGSRRDRPLQTLNCAALTEDLVDSELFGHAKGAFTGAVAERPGLFESAGAGTVFLDEVGELSARAQAKLLRVLQEREVRRVGENFTRPVDSRLIAATNRSLAGEVEAGRFRQDLLYRLDVIRISVPPLRERVEDIPLLAVRFWRDAAERLGSKAVLGQSALAALARYHWPGNVREMQNVMASLAVSVPPRGVVPASAMPAAIAHALKMDPRETLVAARRRFEERFVRAALARAAGHRGQTASALGVSRQGLAKLLQRLQVT